MYIRTNITFFKSLCGKCDTKQRLYNYGDTCYVSCYPKTHRSHLKFPLFQTQQDYNVTKIPIRFENGYTCVEILFSPGFITDF